MYHIIARFLQSQMPYQWLESRDGVALLLCREYMYLGERLSSEQRQDWNEQSD